MAKNIIALNGSASSGGTLYTVPAGRVAKVTISRLAMITGDTITFGGHGWNAGALPGIYASTSATSSAMSTDSYTNSNGSVFPNHLYLAAGQSITYGAYGSPITYNILIVEEY